MNNILRLSLKINLKIFNLFFQIVYLKNKIINNSNENLTWHLILNFILLYGNQECRDNNIFNIIEFGYIV